MRGLTALDLSCNRLGELPAAVSLLTALRVLNLDSNNLQGLPSSVADLASLTDLSFAHNMVGLLPLQMAAMTRLTRLYAAGNHSHCPPREVLTRGVDQVRPFFRPATRSARPMRRPLPAPHGPGAPILSASHSQCPPLAVWGGPGAPILGWTRCTHSVGQPLAVP